MLAGRDRWKLDSVKLEPGMRCLKAFAALSGFFLFFSGPIPMRSAAAKDLAHRTPGYTVKGVVIASDGAVIPEFTVAVKHVSQKPELFPRERFKNGEFSVNGLQKDKYQFQISSPRYIPARLDFDFKSDSAGAIEYSIVILHAYRNETRVQPDAAYTVSVKTLEQKIPDEAQDAYMKGTKLHREGRLDEALMQYGKAVRAAPDFVQALGDLSTIYMLVHRPESALVYLRRAHDIDDSNVIINLNIAITLTEQRDYSGAMKVFTKVLSRNPRLALTQYYIANLKYIQQKYGEAEEHLRQAIQNDPHLLEASLLMTNISLKKRKYDQAREALLHIREAINNEMISKFIDERLSTLESWM